MTPKRQFLIGAVGAGVTALCCFTPVLAVALGAVGLAAWLAWLDLVLLPLLVLFLAVAALAWVRLRRDRQKGAS